MTGQPLERQRGHLLISHAGPALLWPRDRVRGGAIRPVSTIGTIEVLTRRTGPLGAEVRRVARGLVGPQRPRGASAVAGCACVVGDLVVRGGPDAIR